MGDPGQTWRDGGSPVQQPLGSSGAEMAGVVLSQSHPEIAPPIGSFSWPAG
jgi:hypothetical protein